MISHFTLISGWSKDSVDIPRTFTNQAIIVLTCLITEGTSFTVHSLHRHKELQVPLFLCIKVLAERGYMFLFYLSGL